MAKDRLTQHIEDLKATLQSLEETDSRVARYVTMQQSLERAESVNREILEAEEKIPVMAEPKAQASAEEGGGDERNRSCHH